uniref:MATH domain-containing protein n=1 Tax=Meloidogyne hapla TaxID=6305 RepID=A0A1I8B5S5_MELHA
MTTNQSGDTSPGGSNSISNSSVRTTRTSEDEEGQVAAHNAFHLGCCSSPEPQEQDEESDGQCCDDEEALSRLALHSELFRHDSSVGVQTEYNDEFPPLRFLRALGEDPSGFIQQQQQAFYFTGSSDVVPAPLLHLQQPSQQNNNHPPPSQLPIPTLSAATTNIQQSTTTASSNTALDAINASVTMDASSSCSDGTLQLVIQNFRHMSDTVRGPCKYIQTVPWRIMVMPRQHVVQKKGTQKCLGFFLQCCPDAYSESWSCQASAELRLISQKAGIPNFIRKTNHVYTAKENDWGYSCFMTWADILDESQGYIKDDKVTLEVQVKADAPKNILTHSEFKKKIQDYKRLADLQCQRGLIDKAIDCNTQALKFCKDKDPQCKIELEAQKAHLIDMKLKQSIQRIEKGGDLSKIDDDSTTNLNALRQAMGTTTRCGASKATKNKSTNTKDANTTTTNNSSNNTPNTDNGIITDKKQSVQQRVGTPPFTSPNKDVLQTPTKNCKTSKSVEPNENKKTGNVLKSNNNDGQQQQHCGGQTKKRLYKSASTNELSAVGAICKEEFDFMKDRYQEEEDLLPDQIKHFLKHLSEGDKDASRLKEQIAKLELIASPFEKPDPLLLEGIMKLSPEEADKALVKAITFYALERENERDRGAINDPDQLDRLEKVIRTKFCESCLHEGHLQIGKRETSESGCQTEFARRIPREGIPADDATLRIMQQLQQQQQHLLGQHATNEEYINALKTQAFAAVQQQQQQQAVQQNNQAVVNVPTRRKKAAAKKGLQQQQKQQQQQLQEFQQKQQNLIHQQQQLQQQFIQVANARAVQQQQIADCTNQSTVGLVDAMNLDLNNPQMSLFANTKPLLNDMNLAALTNLDLSKIQFSSSDPVTMSETTATNTQGNSNNTVFSRQYIEEWLRYNTRHLLKANFDDKQQQQPSVASSISASSMPGGSNSDAAMASIANQIYSVDPQDVTATQAALFQLHCLNAKNIQNKVDEFVQTLETHANFRDLRNCIDRLLTLCADDENFTSAEDTVSVISVSECSGREFDANKDALQDYSALQRSFIEEDPHDYILLRELKQQEIMLSTRLNSILYQLHQASISDIVDRIEAKVKVLDEKLKISKNECSTLKANDKKINDQLALVQKEFQGINGKYEKLIQQLKDRKNEIKKLEKKAKSEAFMQERLDELQERFDTTKKELANTQRQLAEEQSKYKRDTQSLADSKKHLNTELNAKYSEVQKLNTNLDEKTQALKKLETQLASERKNNTQTVSTLTERVKRAEVNLLEHKLDDGLRILERAKDDCSAQIKVLEAEKQKRTLQSEIDVIKWNIGEWESKREEVASLISQAKTEFAAHIQAVKSGKQLMQLPKLQVPKPPPCPRIHPMPPAPTTVALPSTPNSATTQQQQQQVPPSPLSLDRKAITPPGKTRTGDITTPQTAQQQQQHSTPLSSTSSITSMTTPVKAPGALGTAVAFQSLSSSRGIGSQQQQQPLPPPPPHLPPPIAPIGVRPSNYQNGISIPPPPVGPPSAAAVAHHKFATAVAQQIGQQPPSQTSTQQRHSPQLATHSNPTQFVPSQSTILPQQNFHAIGQPHQTLPSTSLRHQQPPPPTPQQQQQGQGNIVVRPSPSFQSWNGGWSDQLNHLNNISDIFGQGRSFGPLGSDFGGNNNNTNTSGGGGVGGGGMIGGGAFRSASVTNQQSSGGIISSPSNTNNPPPIIGNTPSSQPIGAGRNISNISPSQTQQQQQQIQQQRNGWSTFADTWNPSAISSY